MNIKSQFQVHCPICNTGIAFFSVKRRFNCPACATTLGSNRPAVDVWAALVFVLLLPLAWFIVDRQTNLAGAAPYLAWAVATGAAGVAAYCLLAPRVLWLETDSWSRDTAAAPAGKKHKVLSYRNSARTGPSAGAKKRAS